MLNADEWLADADALGVRARDAVPDGPAYDGPDYDDLPPDLRAQADEHVRKVIAGWETRLIEAVGFMSEEGVRDGKSRGWELLAKDAAWALMREGLNPWNGLSLEDAREAYEAMLPDEMTDTEECKGKWTASRLDAAALRPAAPPPWEAGDEPPAPGDGDDLDAMFPLLDLEAVMDPDRPPREWLWEDNIPRGDQVTLVAPGGTGKSLLSLSLVMRLLSGAAEFIGRKVTFTGTVFYVDQENSEDDWHERLADLGWTQGEVRAVRPRLKVLSLAALPGLDTQRGADLFLRLLDRHGIGAGDLLVLDSTQRVTEGEENSNDTIRNLWTRTGVRLKARGITVLRTDNTGWGGDRERGASAKRDDVGYTLLLEEIDRKTGRFRLTNKKHRAKGGSHALQFKRTTDDDGHLTWVPVASDAAVADFAGLDDLHKDILAVVASLTTKEFDGGGHNGHHEGDLTPYSRVTGLVGGKAVVTRGEIENLVASGLLEKEGMPTQNGPSQTRFGYRLTDAGRAWAFDPDGEQGRTWVAMRFETLADRARAREAKRP